MAGKNGFFAKYNLARGFDRLCVKSFLKDRLMGSCSRSLSANPSNIDDYEGY